MTSGLWRGLLAVSLGMNVLLGAGLLTREIRQSFAAARQTEPSPAPTAPAPRPAAVHSLRSALQDVPAEDARLIRQAFAAAGPTLRPLQQRQRAALEQVRTEISRDPLDTTALRAAMAASVAARDASAAAAGEVLLAVAPRLSMVARQRIAEIGPPRGP